MYILEKQISGRGSLVFLFGFGFLIESSWCPSVEKQNHIKKDKAALLDPANKASGFPA